mgnify:CR=1 FL=1|jgi:organic hydroperoxide reductase OsmC/OhrA
MPKFPIKFEVLSQSKEGVSSLWESRVNSLEPIKCSIPTDFNGPGGGYTPEDLFALSVLNCFIAMFKVHAEKSNLSFSEIKGSAVVTMDSDPNINKISLTELNISIDILGAQDEAKAKELIDFCIENCPVGNSIKTGKIFHVNINKE